ncbi:KDP operon transcriptional regulatory protein KdpE [uncultured Eubacteriales bacterium]|uniref:Stage 0 sporulation protein A homolog n=1 Tax=uncultured Eubacteriales bacterium TaxID=172733 RepID=A0A212J5P5_9FIRM|nr:KDP operon transcriptional regulatory protein KdpE [uncultured Eubacteriales bacterium]
MNHYHERILVVEDDKQIQSFIGYSLETAGFPYIVVSTGESALNHLVSEPIDLMLLDLGLPDFDGMEVIRKVREWSPMPIIVVSARDQDKEKAAALDSGADDYLTKPFSATELLARIRVAVRHLYRQGANNEQAIRCVGQLKIDFEKRLVYLESEEIHVTPLEYNLLSMLFRNMGKVLTTQNILKEIYGMNYGCDTQALRALMAGLRRKIEKNPSKPRYIMTEIGVGYRLVDE